MTARQLHAYERYYKGLSIANSEAKSAFIDGHFKGHAEGLLEGKAEGLAEGKAEGLAEGKAEGLAEGKAEGKAEGASEIAMKLLGKGMPPAEVLDITGLPLLEIEAIAKRMRDT
jgi:Flagellar biosynthesis/type III secretory pathway protein